MHRAAARATAAAVAVGLVLVVTGCSSRVGMPDSASARGDEVIGLWQVLFWTAAALAALVLGLLALIVVRGREGGEGRQSDGHVPLELVYTGVPLLIVAAIFLIEVRTRDRVDADGSRGRPDVVVDATAFQWQWRFAYEGTDVQVLGSPGSQPELVLPVDQVTTIRLHSADVIHAFFVPGFLSKLDVIPGRDNRLDVRPTRVGTFLGHCAEFCGLDHARMNFTVRVVTAEDFEAWQRDQQAAAA